MRQVQVAVTMRYVAALAPVLVTLAGCGGADEPTAGEVERIRAAARTIATECSGRSDSPPQVYDEVSLLVQEAKKLGDRPVGESTMPEILRRSAQAIRQGDAGCDLLAAQRLEKAANDASS